MFLDARIVLFVALALLHFRLWTLALLGAVAVALFILERKKINPSSLPRIAGSYLRGPELRARSPADERQSVDYAFELNDRNLLPGIQEQRAMHGGAVENDDISR